jgi:uncharacterized membrane protein YedE/YeeE
MMRNLAALACGIIFGVGLGVSQMTNPGKVLDFFDVFGAWDPSLAFVMGGAVAVTAIAFRFVLRRPNPLYAESFSLPTKADIDARLLGGSAVYGVGWGLAGFCVGPSIAALAYGDTRVAIFVIAMAVGTALANIATRAKATPLLADG